MFSKLYNVRWAAYSEGASVEDMGVNHCGAHVPMAQQLLDSPDVLSPFQQVCSKGISKGMAARCLGHTGFDDSPFHGLLHQAGIQMLSPLLTRCGILPVLVLRKQSPPVVIRASSHRNVYPLGAW
jgi:hypothetical protein